MQTEDLKRLAALRAADHVRDGMRIGIGSGSTANHFIEILGGRIREGLNITGVPCSERSRILAEKYNIPLINSEIFEELDLTIDGADEVDSSLRLIKGGGGALLREKIVAYSSRKMIVIADISKKVPTLGNFPLPVEVNPFGLQATQKALLDIVHTHSAAGKGSLSLRRNEDRPFLSDGGHYIIDLMLGEIAAPEELSKLLLSVPGVVEHGLFIGYAAGVIFASADGLEELGSF